MRAPSLPPPEWRFFALLLLGGIGLRLLWLAQVHGSVVAPLSAGEATAVAVAFARTGMLADAYFAGQGPTAHLMPLNPAMAGLLFRWLGETSLAATLTLLVWSLAQVGVAYLVVAHVYRSLGMDGVAVRWGLALLCLVPVFVPQEAVDFRYWEGGSAALLGALNLMLLLRCDRDGAIGTGAMTGVAALGGLTLLVSPQVGLASGLCWVVFAIRRLAWRRTIAFGALATAAIVAALLPWTLRNAEVLGAPVVLRSNVGIELAIANHPAALSDDSPEQVFANRIGAVHPAANAAAQAAVRDIGEVAYARRLGVETWQWIAAHPGAFARLWLRHLREFAMPSAWQMYFSGWEGLRDTRAVVVSIVNALGLIALAIALIRGQRGYGYLALYIAALALPFAAFQPTARYTYLLWALLAYPAVALLLGVARRSSAWGPATAR